MEKLVILGAGRIGRRIAELVSSRARPVLVDHDTAKLDAAEARGLAVAPLPFDLPRDWLRRELAGASALVAVDPFLPPSELVRLCCEAGCHYLDLQERDDAARDVAIAAEGAPAALRFVPGCGLAPGFVTALLAEEIARSPASAEITAYVGVLPLHPANRLGYADIWGVSGLIQEYTRPVLELRDGALAQGAPLGGLETLTLDGIALEAFSTAGSIDALARRHEGALRGLAFKTLRYPGHCDYMLFLLDDLGLRQQLRRLSSLLMTSLPATEADRVTIALRIVETPGAEPRWRSWHHLAAPGPDGELRSAMATLAAAHVIATWDHLRTAPGEVPVLMPGDVPLARLQQSPAFAFLAPEAAAASRSA
ncbi:saccharopine dehydrogenase C-terminal domain-containing protein (plasmid) [Salipiger sp. H15]|uniref:Saccharopine dehydrogenase C-terminal domain-containing protein n=1 Tax=Alloyangia sp. H15 TaxID=3029062 RepID=A0AAU8ARA5_9RHOB